MDIQKMVHLADSYNIYHLGKMITDIEVINNENRQVFASLGCIFFTGCNNLLKTLINIITLIIKFYFIKKHSCLLVKKFLYSLS